MIDWMLFLLLMGSILLIAYGSYREGVEEGWRQAGRWADDLEATLIDSRPATRLDYDGKPPYPTEATLIDSRPATRLDDDGKPPYSIL